MPISRRLIMRVPKVLLKIIPIVYVIPLVNPFRYLGLVIYDGMFLRELNSVLVPLSCTQIG